MADALQILLPKKRQKPGGVASTTTYRPGQATLSLPQYRDHLTDLFDTRLSGDSRTLMSSLSRHDSDVSAAFFAYQSIAGSADHMIKAYDMNNQLSPDGIALANQILQALTTITDYTQGFSMKPSLSQLNDDMRYWTLMRGSPGVELVLNKQFAPDSIRMVDMGSIYWSEPSPGVYKPEQRPTGQSAYISLDIPTFFVARFGQNPVDIYTYSPFVAAINTIAARVQVINELYRITQVVGYPRMDIEVVEEILLKSAPTMLRADAAKTREFVNAQVAAIRTAFSALRSEEPLVHTDAVKVDMINDSRPATSLPISNVIDILDQQNQAALKTMPAVIGKGNGTGQIASVEARLFALNCDFLNRVVGDIWSQLLTFAVRLAGFQGYVSFEFEPIELRPILELEPQLTMKQARLQTDLSLGLIDDDTYHLEMYGHPRPATAPVLSGTNFDAKNAQVDTTSISPNSDPLGRSLAPEGAKSARSNTVKSGSAGKP